MLLVTVPKSRNEACVVRLPEVVLPKTLQSALPIKTKKSVLPAVRPQDG